MTSHLIRPATSGDAKAITALAIRSKAFWGYSEAFMDACREELTVSPEKIASDRFLIFVLEREELLLGYYALETLEEHTLEIDALFIEPDHMGQGLGKALMAHVKQTAKEQGVTSLIVQSDPFAERFYLAAGGTRVGSRASGSIPDRSLPILTFDLASTP